MEEVSMALFDNEIEVLGLAIYVPGVRITLWLAGAIILVAGYIASRALHAGARANESAASEPRPDPGAGA
jgi:hypothetical protein